MSIQENSHKYLTEKQKNSIANILKGNLATYYDEKGKTHDRFQPVVFTRICVDPERLDFSYAFPDSDITTRILEFAGIHPETDCPVSVEVINTITNIALKLGYKKRIAYTIPGENNKVTKALLLLVPRNCISNINQ